MSDQDQSDKTNPVWGPMGGGAPKHPKFVLDQVKNLQTLQKMLEGIVDQKQAEIAGLQEKLLRLKHGGGS